MRTALSDRLFGAVGWAGCLFFLSGGAALASGGQLFPVASHLVPGAVVAAFMLPAAAAGFVSALRRARRRPMALVAIGLVGGAALAVCAYVNPAILTRVSI